MGYQRERERGSDQVRKEREAPKSAARVCAREYGRSVVRELLQRVMRGFACEKMGEEGKYQDYLPLPHCRTTYAAG